MARFRLDKQHAAVGRNSRSGPEVGWMTLVSPGQGIAQTVGCSLMVQLVQERRQTGVFSSEAERRHTER